MRCYVPDINRTLYIKGLSTSNDESEEVDHLFFSHWKGNPPDAKEVERFATMAYVSSATVKDLMFALSTRQESAYKALYFATQSSRDYYIGVVSYDIEKNEALVTYKFK